MSETERSAGIFGKISRVAARVGAASGLASVGILGLASRVDATPLLDPSGITPTDKISQVSFSPSATNPTLEENNLVINAATPINTESSSNDVPSIQAVAVTEKPEEPTSASSLPSPKPIISPASIPASPSPIPATGVVGIEGSAHSQALYTLEAEVGKENVPGVGMSYNHDTGNFTIVVRGDKKNLDNFLASKGLTENDLPLSGPIKVRPS